MQGIHGMQAAQGAGAGQQQNVVMVQPSQNLTSMTSNPASSNACKFNAIFFLSKNFTWQTYITYYHLTCLLFSVPNSAAGIQAMANASDSQPITITNGQGQQITVIPSQSLQQQIRPTNANIIQMPNSVSGLQAFPVQNIPGLGNVQVNLSRL